MLENFFRIRELPVLRCPPLRSFTVIIKNHPSNLIWQDIFMSFTKHFQWLYLSSDHHFTLFIGENHQFLVVFWMQNLLLQTNNDRLKNLICINVFLGIKNICFDTNIKEQALFIKKLWQILVFRNNQFFVIF